MHWRRWFAWRPVIIYGRAGKSRVVWLQYVERIWTEDIISDLGPRWVYRRQRQHEADNNADDEL